MGRGRLTFLINMYRSSGISGARPIGREEISLRQSERPSRGICVRVCGYGIIGHFLRRDALFSSLLHSGSEIGTVPFDLRIRRILLPVRKRKMDIISMSVQIPDCQKPLLLPMPPPPQSFYETTGATMFPQSIGPYAPVTTFTCAMP